MPLLKPDRYFSRITKIDPREDIKKLNIDFLFLDVDNTILPRDTRQVPQDIKAWLEDLKNSGLKICLLSNSLKEGVKDFAKTLDLPVLTGSLKPSPSAFIRAFKKMGARSKNSLLIGDQVFTDSLGAHLVGMKCYMVLPLSEFDLPHTLFFRTFEKFVLKNKKLEK